MTATHDKYITDATRIVALLDPSAKQLQCVKGQDRSWRVNFAGDLVSVDLWIPSTGGAGLRRGTLSVEWVSGKKSDYDLSAPAHTPVFVARHVLTMCMLDSSERRRAALDGFLQRVKDVRASQQEVQQEAQQEVKGEVEDAVV